MKRRLLIGVFAAIFFIGIIMVLNRNPSVDIGKVYINSTKESTEAEGTDIIRVNGDKEKALDDEPDMIGILDTMQSFELYVKANKSTNTVKVNTDMAVGFKGKYYDVKYSIYDFDGKNISKDVDSLVLPTADIDGCIVKISVKWGREKNYVESIYYFRLNYNKESA